MQYISYLAVHNLLKSFSNHMHIYTSPLSTPKHHNYTINLASHFRLLTKTFIKKATILLKQQEFCLYENPLKIKIIALK